MQTYIDLPFGDGTYRFRLTLPLINELQRKTGSGIGALFARVIAGRYRSGLDGSDFGSPEEAQYSVADVIEPIRYGLLGGGMGWVDGEKIEVDAAVAQSLMEAHVFPARPLAEAWGLAAAVLMATVEGYVEPNPQKKSEEHGEESSPEPTHGLTGRDALPA